MTRPGPDRRAFVALSASMALAPTRPRAAEVGEPALAYWNEPIATGDIAPGDWRICLLDGDPIVLRRRTPVQIAKVRAEPVNTLPDPARDEDRAPGGEWLVVSGLCTHAGCKVQCGLGPYDGWACLCHGSIYDLSGRVRQGPAKRNLPVIAHTSDRDRLTLHPG